MWDKRISIRRRFNSERKKARTEKERERESQVKKGIRIFGDKGTE